ncbi:MAG: tRNA epoxyqueuosine(34) reductase QueG [Actinomycetota bacterium]
MALVDELRRIALDSGLEEFGIAEAQVLERARRELFARKSAGLSDDMGFTYRNPERSTDPFAAVQGARSVIVAARSYQRPDPMVPSALSARVARYAWTDHYAPLRDGLRAVATHLRAAGHRAVAYADDNTVVDREVAHRAGIGWFGKNANLLVPGRGSWFVLGCVITDAVLPPSPAPVEDGCGTCHRCIDGCPTGAIVAPGVIDARRCLAWLVQKPGIFPMEFREALGDRIYGCDDCQDVCPINRRSDPAPEGVAAPELVAWVPVLELLDLDDATILERHGRWYLHGRDPVWVRRNALVILGNTGDGQDAAVEASLVRYLQHPNPVLRAHAVWAARRLGRNDLLPDTDSDPSVRAELMAP